MRVISRGFAFLSVVPLSVAGPVSALAMQDTQVVAHTVSVSDRASSLNFEMSDGSEITIAFRNGQVVIGDQPVGRYTGGSSLERSWRAILSQAGKLSSDELLAAVRTWEAEGDTGTASEIRNAVEQQLQNVVAAGEAAGSRPAAEAAAMTMARQAEREQEVATGPDHSSDEILIDLRAFEESLGVADQIDQYRDQLDQIDNLGMQVENARVHVGDLTVPRGDRIDNDLIVLAGDVSVFGEVDGDLVALDGDVILHSSGSVAGDLVTVNGTVTRAGGSVGGRIRSSGVGRNRTRNVTDTAARRASSATNGTSVASLLGMFVALACIGFGFAFFMPRQLEVVSETVTESFGRSFLAGLFAQPLILPAFAMLIVGLVITVVGILVVPFAIVGSVLALVAAAAGGYLAVAKAVGSTYLNRRMASGAAVVATPYRSLVYGLVGLMAIWVPAAFLGWIPLVGDALALLAGIFTWVMITAGFGGALLSRAGLRATFARPGHRPALTDEHYWPTTGNLPSTTQRPTRR